MLLKHEAVREAAVVGVPHGFWGEEVTAFIVPETGQEIDVASINQHCKSTLPPDAVPTRFHFIEELPRTQTGKIKRTQLEHCL